MGLNLVAAPASDPIALDEAKSHCRVSLSVTDEDGLIAGYILAARQHAEGYTRRAFVAQTWGFTLDDDWPQAVDRRIHRTQDRITLPKPPVQSVASVSYVDLNGASQILDPSQYRVARLNQERAEAFIEPAFGVTWPSVRRQSETITVRMICGYDATLNPFPETIRQAMLLTIKYFFDNRGDTDQMPPAAENLLFPYRLFY